MNARPLADAEGGCKLVVRVAPRGKRDEIIDIMADDTVKIRLNAPPVDGKANQALIKYLSKILGVSKSAIEIASGATSRNKLLSVEGIGKKELFARLRAQLKA